MEARNRKIEDWYGKIHRGEIKLPRFQRYEAWDWKRISSLFNTITQNLPLGITLVLEVGEKEQFISRYLVSAPTTNSRVLEQLLDGQQRLTALWRVLHNNYEFETFYVYIPEFDIYGEKESDERTAADGWCRSRGEGLGCGRGRRARFRPSDAGAGKRGIGRAQNHREHARSVLRARPGSKNPSRA